MYNMHSTHKIAYVYKLIEILNLVACIFASVVQHEKHGGGFMQSYNAQSIEILNFQSTEFVACVCVCVYVSVSCRAYVFKNIGMPRLFTFYISCYDYDSILYLYVLQWEIN